MQSGIRRRLTRRTIQSVAGYRWFECVGAGRASALGADGGRAQESGVEDITDKEVVDDDADDCADQRTRIGTHRYPLKDPARSPGTGRLPPGDPSEEPRCLADPSQPTGRIRFRRRGRGGSAFGFAAQAWAGVIRPGSAWWGRSVL